MAGTVAFGCTALWDQAWLVYLGIALVAAAIILRVRLKPSYSDLSKQAQVDRDRAEDSARCLQGALESILHRIAKHCEIDQYHQRISIYCHVDEEFVKLARNSSNPTLAKSPGRNSYPENEGVIGEAWREGQSSTWGLPEKRDDWDTLQADAWGIEKSVASQISMQARSLVALRLTHESRHVGIIVMESLHPRGVRKNCLTPAQESLLIESVCEILASAQPHFPAIAEHLKRQSATVDDQETGSQKTSIASAGYGVPLRSRAHPGKKSTRHQTLLPGTRG